MVKILISAKIATIYLLQINIVWNKSHDAKISVYDVNNKTLSRESNYILDVVIWPKFGNSSISMIEILSSILQGFDQKTTSLKEWSWFKLNNLALALGMGLKFYTSVAKGLKLKVRKVLGLIPTFAVTGEKLLEERGGILCCPLPHSE